MSHKTFTHKDLAKQLGVSETTVKSYRRKFPGCIPLYSHGKPIRFSHDALAVCKKIRDLFEQGMSINEVRSRLVLEFSWVEPAENQAPASDEFKHEAVNNLKSPVLEEDNQNNFSSKPDAFGGLPQSFTTAISGLAKSVVALTRQQSVILERLTGLEKKITPEVLNNAQAQPAHFEQLPENLEFATGDILQKQDGRAENSNPDFLSNPKWADDLASRLEGMEQVLVRTLASFEGQLGGLSGVMEGEKTNSSHSSQTSEAGTSFGSPESNEHEQTFSPENLGSAGLASEHSAPRGNISSGLNFAKGGVDSLQSKKSEELVFSDVSSSSASFSTQEPEPELVLAGKDGEKGRVLPWNDREGAAQKMMYKVKSSIPEGQVGQLDQKEERQESPQATQSSKYSELLPPTQGASDNFTQQKNQGSRQISNTASTAQVVNHRQGRYSEDFLRHISGLPLAVSVSGDHVSLSGRAPFSLNDLKAILAQTFSPPEHYSGRWETASGECWYILEQPEVDDGEGLSLHLRPVLNRRNVQMLELVHFMVGGAYEHPSSLYSFVQEWLG